MSPKNKKKNFLKKNKNNNCNNLKNETSDKENVGNCIKEVEFVIKKISEKIEENNLILEKNEEKMIEHLKNMVKNLEKTNETDNMRNELILQVVWRQAKEMIALLVRNTAKETLKLFEEKTKEETDKIKTPFDQELINYREKLADFLKIEISKAHEEIKEYTVQNPKFLDSDEEDMSDFEVEEEKISEKSEEFTNEINEDNTCSEEVKLNKYEKNFLEENFKKVIVIKNIVKEKFNPKELLEKIEDLMKIKSGIKLMTGPKFEKNINSKWMNVFIIFSNEIERNEVLKEARNWTECGWFIKKFNKEPVMNKKTRSSESGPRKVNVLKCFNNNDHLKNMNEQKKIRRNVESAWRRPIDAWFGPSQNMNWFNPWRPVGMHPNFNGENLRCYNFQRRCVRW